MNPQNATVRTPVNSPIFTLAFNTNDLYTIGAVILFLILLILLFCTLFYKRRRNKGRTKIAVRDYI